jgi:excisionase family DNA binding protein
MDTDTAVKTRAVSVADAAKVMGIGVTHAWRLIGEGVITPVRLGGRTLVELSEIDRVLASHRSPRTAA